MIQINQLKLKIPHTDKEMETKIRKTLKLKPEDKITWQILHRAIDGRKKPELFYVYNVAVSVKKEDAVIKKAHTPSVMKYHAPEYRIPHAVAKPGTTQKRPVIIGAGPAGLFAACILTEAGLAPIVIERGRPVEERQKDVEKFWETGILNTASNVQFGEGGAGTFSDGKLNTSVKDPSGRNHFVLETFVKYGASSDILIDAKPHIGTDVLSKVISNMRKDLISKGCTFLFETRVCDFQIEETITGQKLTGLFCEKTENGENENPEMESGLRITGTHILPSTTRNGNGKVSDFIETDHVVLAIGHSSRDTFSCLNNHQIPMVCKSFAVGFRVEHPQSMIDEAMYGHQDTLKLPAAPYKVTANFTSDTAMKRGVYSFCMCPGGYVVNSSSEEGRTVVNGMSYSGRHGANANSAVIVSVTPEDFGGSDPLAGVRYQKHLEEETFRRGQGKIPQQLYGDFCQKIISSTYGDFASCTKGGTVFAGLNGLLSDEMEESFKLGMSHFARIVPNFDRKDAILSGIESRTSSPVRILRDDFMQSSVKGLYPCGEGAGYAGGITSAAIDGIKVAEAMINDLNS